MSHIRDEIPPQSLQRFEFSATTTLAFHHQRKRIMDRRMRLLCYLQRVSMTAEPDLETDIVIRPKSRIPNDEISLRLGENLPRKSGESVVLKIEMINIRQLKRHGAIRH